VHYFNNKIIDLGEKACADECFRNLKLASDAFQHSQNYSGFCDKDYVDILKGTNIWGKK
jgi:hypothetical protein